MPAPVRRGGDTDFNSGAAAETGTRREHVYQAITRRMIEALETDTVPWQKPWRSEAGRPLRMNNGQGYRGINVLLLSLTAQERGYQSRWWGTVKQINELGGHVRKGQTRQNGAGSTTVIWFKMLKREQRNPETGEPETASFPIARAYSVFNADQCDDLPDRFYPDPGEVQVLPEPQAVLEAYLANGGPRLRHVHGNRAYYQAEPDLITLPQQSQFRSAEHYYATAGHECVHSTGHPSRLKREGIEKFDHFGSERYSKEELVAEMGAAILAAETGIDRDDLFTNSTAYIASWLRVLKDDRSLVISAAAKAQRAVDLILGAVTPAEVDGERADS